MRQLVARGGPIEVAHAARVERDHAPAGLGEQRHHITPCVPALRPAGQQQDRRAAAAFDEMQPHALDSDGIVVELRPERRRVEGRQCVCGGGLNDVMRHGVLLVGSG